MNDDDQCPDCVDCKTSLLADAGYEWPSIGPICYACLDDRRESLEAEVERLTAEINRLTLRWSNVTPTEEGYYLTRPIASGNMLEYSGEYGWWDGNELRKAQGLLFAGPIVVQGGEP